MIQSAWTRSLLALAAVGLLGVSPALAAKHEAKKAAPPQGLLYVPDGKGGFREATEHEINRAVESPASPEGEKASFIDIKRYDLGIYTLLVFGILYLFIQFKVWPHIADGLKKREAGIQGLRDEAQKIQQDAEEIRAKLQKEYAEAQDKIRSMLDEARRDADALRVQEREAGAKDAAAERERAKREIEAAKDAALDELYRQTVDLATTLSAKTISRQISADDHRRLLDESLAELKQAAKTA